MGIFKNVFLTLGFNINIDFKNLVQVRRAKMIEEGYDVSSINWDLYARVLEAKREMLSRE
jgi:hypothetical protein